MVLHVQMFTNMVQERGQENSSPFPPPNLDSTQKTGRFYIFRSFFIGCLTTYFWK